MDFATLERNISNLESSIDSLEVWLTLMTGLVVLGLVIEYWYEIPEAISELKEGKEGRWKPICTIIGAVLITIGVGGELVVQFKASAEGTDLRKANDAISVGLKTAASEAIERAGKAVERASKADERAAANEKEAATLRKLAAEESLARVKIEKQLAPRTLSEADRETIGKQLHSFASHFSGRKVTISSYSGDAEGIVFSLEIMDILTRAGIDVDPVIGRLIPVGLVNLGVKVTGPIADGKFIGALVTGIRAHVDTDLSGEWDSKYAEVGIEVGVKPVAGLPIVIPGHPQ